MTVDRLTASLADRYRFERELAIKVLDPELAAVLGAVATRSYYCILIATICE